ncbi:hypothetical protein [Flavobacteriaceae bacterium 14752]|uniref:hypothetical protein n=1 Tax=Mesohalobacter salilacus TaxID=2491711 RepID=UPI000F639A00|nr:hypothetical protein EIG84_00665 [Flavobacteriaceae bacterium 14752]
MQTAKNISKYLLSVGAIFLLSTYLYFDNSSTFGHILTFLSVTTGFTITALSIIATSNFSKDLYKKEAPDDNSKTLLHQLVGKFEKSTLTFASAIVLILIFSLIEPTNFKEWSFFNTTISFKTVLSGSIWFLTFMSIWLFVDLLRMFSKFVIQSAKRQ